jgi:hypothetical protein
MPKKSWRASVLAHAVARGQVITVRRTLLQQEADDEFPDGLLMDWQQMDGG